MSNESITSTSVVFLGLCERYNGCEDQVPPLMKHNIIGLRNTVLVSILPQMCPFGVMIFAYAPTEQDYPLTLSVKKPSGQVIFAFQLNEPNLVANSNYVPKDKRPSVVYCEPGWVIFAYNCKDLVLAEVGGYAIYASTAADERKIGSFAVVPIELPELNSETILAIRSNPNSYKRLHMELKCKHCASGIRIYTGLQRDSEQENAGWSWSEILPDTYECKCSKFKVDLQLIRRNFRRTLARFAERTPGVDEALEQMGLVRTYERHAIFDIVSKLSRLVYAENVREEELQVFIQDNPIVLNSFSPLRVYHKSPITTRYFCDFALITPKRELVLVEIEKPAIQLLKENGEQAANLTHAFEQVKTWIYEATKDRRTVLHGIIDRNDEIKIDEITNIKGVLIAGRDDDYKQADLHRLKMTDHGNVEFYTYDDIINMSINLARHLSDV